MLKGDVTTKDWPKSLGKVAFSISLNDLYYLLNTRKAHRCDFEPQKGPASQLVLDRTSALGGLKRVGEHQNVCSFLL